MDVALELAQDAKVPVPLGGLVDQLMKGINQDRMKTLLGSMQQAPLSVPSP
jgi:hypothetical protein